MSVRHPDMEEYLSPVHTTRIYGP